MLHQKHDLILIQRYSLLPANPVAASVSWIVDDQRQNITYTVKHCIIQCLGIWYQCPGIFHFDQKICLPMCKIIIRSVHVCAVINKGFGIILLIEMPNNYWAIHVYDSCLHNDSNASLAHWSQGNHCQDCQQEEQKYHQVTNEYWMPAYATRRTKYM